jgi:hypothetical protein
MHRHFRLSISGLLWLWVDTTTRSATWTDAALSMKVLYLEGFSSGPGLPFPLLYGNNDIEVLHPRMPYYWRDILFNPYAWLSLCILSFVVSMILPQLLNFSRQSLKALLYYLLLLLISFHLLYYFKMLAVRWTVDICVSQMEKEITLHQPNVIIGYSWGGGIASFLIERKIWLGHTLLIAPAGSLLALHSGRPSPSLQIFPQSQSQSLLFIVQGSHDPVTSYSDNWKLYQDAVRDRVTSTEQGADLTIQFIPAQGQDHALHGFVTREFLLKIFQKMNDRK